MTARTLIISDPAWTNSLHSTGYFYEQFKCNKLPRVDPIPSQATLHISEIAAGGERFGEGGGGPEGRAVTRSLGHLQTTEWSSRGLQERTRPAAPVCDLLLTSPDNQTTLSSSPTLTLNQTQDLQILEKKVRGGRIVTPRRVWSDWRNHRQNKWIDFPIMDSEQFSLNWLLHLWKFPSHLFSPQRIWSCFCLLLRREKTQIWIEQDVLQPPVLPARVAPDGELLGVHGPRPG